MICTELAYPNAQHKQAKRGAVHKQLGIQSPAAAYRQLQSCLIGRCVPMATCIAQQKRLPEAHTPCEAELAVHGTSHLRRDAQSGAGLEAALPHHRYQHCLYCPCNILILQIEHKCSGYLWFTALAHESNFVPPHVCYTGLDGIDQRLGWVNHLLSSII